MNGIHDMGGLHGFGTVEVETDEPVFHQRWEARVFGMTACLSYNIDAGRHSLERLGPVTYLQNGYYGRWLAALERTLAETGVATAAEVEERVRAIGGGEPRGRATTAAGDMPSKRTPEQVSSTAGSASLAHSSPRGYVRPLAAAPLFRAGETVITRNHQPAGHTRLPAYARCRRGVVTRVHPAMVFPDDHAHGRGENPQYLYTVRFDGGELWGADAEPGTVVHLDLFESYLESAETEAT